MSKHTPGPWKTFRPHSTIYIEARLRGSTIQEVASCGPTETPERQEANARLIAAAPDLLEALQLCEGNIASLLASSHPKVYGEWLTVVRSAIGKATGETK